jgi:hypothetical protein
VSAASPAARALGATPEQVIANMGSVAAPSFDGQGWLVALNLGWMTAGFCLCLMLTAKMVRDIWRCRAYDRLREGAQIARLMILCFATAGVLRFGGEAFALWGWDPRDPAMTVAAAHTKRLLDPISAPLAFLGFGVWVLAEPSFIAQLRLRPPPVNMWRTLSRLRRPALVTALCFAVAIGVVTTR